MRIEVPVKTGTMVVECTEEFLEIIQKALGHADEAAIRQFIHGAITHAMQGKLQEQHGA